MHHTAEPDIVRRVDDIRTKVARVKDVDFQRYLRTRYRH